MTHNVKSVTFSMVQSLNINSYTQSQRIFILVHYSLGHIKAKQTKMGRGGMRQKARTSVSEAYDRFRCSLAPSVKKLDYTEHLSDNYNFGIVQLLVHNPMSQAELLKDISTKAAASRKGIAIAIAFSWRLKALDHISDEACEKLVGLFLFAAVNLDKRSLLAFFKRCPNVKSLSLVYMDATDAKFLHKAFASGLLQSLEYIEVSHASDDAIAAMVSAPNLCKIVFRYADEKVTNAGFERLVQNGGGKQLLAIQVCNRVSCQFQSRCSTSAYLLCLSIPQASVERSEISKTLSCSFLKETLPKFLSGEGKVRDLVCMSTRPRTMNKRPLSAVSVNIGVKTSGKAMSSKKDPRQNMSSDQAKNLALDVLKTQVHPLVEEAREFVRKVRSLESCIFKTDLYPTMTVVELRKALDKFSNDPDVEYNYEKPYKMRRWELVEALHRYKFQGGGTARMQLKALKPKQAQQILRHLDRAAKKAATLFIIAGGKDAILEPLVPLVLRSELSQIAKVLESY